MVNSGGVEVICGGWFTLATVVNDCAVPGVAPQLFTASTRQ